MSVPAAASDPTAGSATASSRSAGFSAVFATEAAFRAWYDDAAPRVYAYLAGRCGGDVALAEELTQQTFMSAVRGRAGYDGRAEPLTWLIAIARNHLVDHFRRLEREERRHLRVVVAEIPASRSQEDPWRGVDLRDSVLTALRGLPPAQRAALVLHHVDGLAVREVAVQMKRSPSAVESLLARGRERFRRLFEEADHG